MTKRTLTAHALVLLLAACEAAPGDESTDVSPPAGRGDRPTATATVSADHTVEFYDLGDRFLINETRPVGARERFTDELADTMTVAEIFQRLSPGTPAPAALKDVGRLVRGHRAGLPAATPRSAADTQTIVQAHTPTESAGEDKNTGTGGCSAAYAQANTFCKNATAGGHWDDDPFIEWCQPNYTWSFVSFPSATDGEAWLCSDSGEARFYVVHDNSSHYAEKVVPAGHASVWRVLYRQKCNFLTGCKSDRNRYIKFGFHPTGNAHFSGSIRK